MGGDLNVPLVPREDTLWKLNESLLQNQRVMEDVIREVSWVFETNDTQECAPGVIWEAHKAVIRGVLIKHGTRIKREREEKLTALLTAIHRLETIQKQTRFSDVERDLLKACRQVTDLLLYKAQKIIQIGRKHAYKSGNKCGKLLADYGSEWEKTHLA